MQHPRILLADDDVHLRHALELRLARAGFRVQTAASGLDVLRLAPTGLFDALILDHGMQGGDGRTVGRIVRHETDAPIVFLSGHASDDFAAILADLPHTYFVPKPPDVPRLARLLRKALAVARAAPQA